ncbi:MAG: hypothetical protein KDK29_13330, partial [Sedimentitalea sp.]|nr:hypothetical protein [Sedimentitalea sp.]
MSQMPAPFLPAEIDAETYADEQAVLARLIDEAKLRPKDRAAISAAGADLVRAIRAETSPGMMEVFLA